MIVWIDADACPRDARELVFRAVDRMGFDAKLVANSPIRIPKSDYIEMITVGKRPDEADDYIAEHVEPGDLVITQDIPLAARIVDVGALGMDSRGQIFDEDNVKNKLATRNLLADLREWGMVGGGPPPYKPKDRNKFAAALDRLLTKLWHEQNNT